MYNVSTVPQRIAKVWIPPQQAREIPIHVALRYHQDNRFQVDMKKLREQLVPSYLDNRLRGLTLMSPFSISDGYGQGSVFMADGLLGLSIDMDLYPCGWYSAAGIPERVRDVLANSQKHGYDIGIGRGYPTDVMHRLPAKTLLCNTMWESDRIPEEWVPGMNRCAAILLPCEAQFEIFRESGVKRPMYTIPEPVDTAYWSERTQLPNPKEFKIVSWSRMSSRKMPLEMLQVFSYVFPADQYPDVVFELKTNNGQFGMGSAGIPHIRDKRIRIHDGIWSLDRLRDWASSANAGFFLSRGEGMFVPPMQAMCLGLPVIVPNHTGPSDYADTRYNYPVKLDPKEPLVPSPMGEGLRWWNPSLDHAAEQLKKLYDNYKEAQRRGKAAQKMIQERYSILSVANRIVRVAEEYGR